MSDNLATAVGQQFSIDLSEQESLLAELKSRTDAEGQRMARYLALPDLSRTPGSPLYELVQRVKQMPLLRAFDQITIPEIVPADVSFDLFDFAPDHPARSQSDTYFIDDNHILRTHDTVFWYYYLNLPAIKQKIAQRLPLGTLCYGKVYRKDEIDRQHMNIFHQMGGWYLVPDDQPLEFDDLKNVLGEIVKSIFGPAVEYRFNDDIFPYTDPSLEVEIKLPQAQSETWVEVLGGGMPKQSVLKKMGLVGYKGWAFGFGLERLAMISLNLPDIRLLWSQDERIKKQLKLGQQYVEVSRYPAVTRDISFIVSDDFSPNDYFDLVREVVGEDLVEEMKLLDHYQDPERFGQGMVSYTYRIVYRRLDRTLTHAEVDRLHHHLEQATVQKYRARIR